MKGNPMFIKKEDFLPVLKELEVATDADKAMNSNCFIFEDGYIHASNVLITGQYKFDDNVPNCAIVAKRLIEIISKCPRSEVRLEFQADKLRIISGKFKGTLTYNTIEADSFKKIKATKWEEASDLLVHALTQCASITQNASNFNDSSLSLVHITDKYVESSDSFQIFHYDVPINTTETLISGTLLAKVLKFYPIQYNFTKTHFQIVTNNNVILSILGSTKATYQDHIHKTIKEQNTLGSHQLENTDSLIDAIQRTSILAKKSQGSTFKLLKIQIVPNGFILIGENEAGMAREVVKMKHKIPEQIFITGAEFLVNALKEAVNIKFTDNFIFMHTDNHKRIIGIQREEDI